MLTFGLQWAYALALVAVAMLSAAVARRPGDGFQRLGWVITAAAFSVHSLDLVVQCGFGSVAIAGGRGTPEMAAYLRWAPIFDHSRTFLMMATALCLATLGVLRQVPTPRLQRRLMLVLAVGLAVGATLGAGQRGATRAAHYASVAIWDVAELILLLVTLFMLLLSNRVDRYLWALLAMYACTLALGTFWVTLLSQLGQGWNPPHWTLALLRVVLYSAMAAIAALRWRAGAQGRPIPGMLGGATAKVQAWG